MPDPGDHDDAVSVITMRGTRTWLICGPDREAKGVAIHARKASYHR
jgi:hypothetical protein